MDKDFARRIFEQVKDNRRKLESCKYHEFSTVVRPNRLRCKHCGGEVDLSYKLAYEEGLKHLREKMVMEKARLKRGYETKKVECCSQVCSEDCPNYSKCPEVLVVILESGESYGAEV
jgi:hypothetical protein